MSRMRTYSRGSDKFYTRGLRLYPREELYKEMSFISYYFHWSNEEVMALDHMSRRQWCSQISAINKSINPSDSKSKEKSILEFKG